MENAENSRHLLRRLTQFVRYKHARRGQLLPLADELGMAGVLFELSQARFGEQLVTEVVCAPGGEVDLNACYVPHYAVLAFVENSVYHAFNDTEPPWRVAVRVRRSDGTVTVVVEDNGSGFDPQPYLHRDGAVSVADAETYGSLPVTLARLSAQFGRDHTVQLESSADGGTRAAITMPVG